VVLCDSKTFLQFTNRIYVRIFVIINAYIGHNNTRKQGIWRSKNINVKDRSVLEAMI